MAVPLLNKLLAAFLRTVGTGLPQGTCRTRLNWERGLLRLWVAATGCWIAFSVFEHRLPEHAFRYWTLTQAESDPATPENCLALLKAMRTGHKSLSDHENDLLLRMDAGSGECREVFINANAGKRLKDAFVGFLGYGVFPPLAVLFTWWIGAWVAKGFRGASQKPN